MDYCPKCHANVEGLLYRCDCCGASLEPPKKHFFACGIYELPQCLGFSSITRELLSYLQPETPEKYESFLREVGIKMVCYPESILTDGNIKTRVQYSFKKKQARMTLIVDYDDFITSDSEEKKEIIANVLLHGIHLLQARLHKSNLSIDDIVTQANNNLGKYISQ